MKTAFITGVAGQDGSYLSEFLLAKDYQVFGLAKKTSNKNNVPAGVNILEGDLSDLESLKAALEKSVPDEVYNFAGVSDLKTAYENPERTIELNNRSVEFLINEALRINKDVRFAQASSSEVFLTSSEPLKEDSPRDINTTNPYARAKMMTDDFIAQKRESNEFFLCSAILFNHESPRRPEKFVSRKITRTLVKIKLGLADSLPIGNLDVYKDWGFAGDYVEVMYKMLNQDKAEDFIVATGKKHSIRDFINIASNFLGLEITWQGEGVNAVGVDKEGRVIVKVEPDFYKPSTEYAKVGDIRKAEEQLNWKPKVDFVSLVEMMVEADLKELNSN